MGLGNMPSQLIEASNGVLLVLFAYMTLFALMYLARKWQDALPAFGGKYGWARAAKMIYLDQKPAISITVIVSGLFIRTLPLWYWRHMLNHDRRPHWPILHNLAPYLFWFGTIAIIVGIVCWVRVVSPFQHTNMAWAIMIAGAISFAVLMAM